MRPLLHRSRYSLRIGGTMRFSLAYSRPYFESQPFGAIELWWRGTRYRLAVRRWRPYNEQRQEDSNA